MGQFLSIGIVTKMGISKERKIKEYNLTTDEINNGLAKKHDLTLYHLTETENFIKWEIDQSVLLQELTSFLSCFYPLYYNKASRNDAVIPEIKKCRKYSEIIEIANKKKYENFQMDEYGGTIIGVGKRDIGIYLQYDAIMLAIEGKIFMESYDSMFSFFSKSIKYLLKDFKLAGAISVYITG